MAKIAIVDDEPSMVEVIATLARDEGHDAYPFNSASKLLDQLNEIAPHLVIADLKMGAVGGFDVLKACQEKLPNTAVIMITGFASVETAVDAMKLGAYDYITKPFKVDELILTIRRALDHQATVKENRTLKKALQQKYRFENIVGTSKSMQDIYNLIAKVANTDSTILIQGESGTGKELVARALHFNSNRQHRPFVAINCSALPENLLESELFGHKKGAFTGAVQDKVGLFEEAQEGTIFLDEINSMQPPLQTKLLRVLQERQIRRVGDTKSLAINVRVVAATNEPLEEKIKTGSFREDLYYRLAVIPIVMPPLRERIEDIPLLANHFLKKLATQSGLPEPPRLDQTVIEALGRYQWPGNVRELENAFERACALCEGGVIRLEDLPPAVVEASKGGRVVASGEMPIGMTLEEFSRQQERAFIEATLKFHDGSREKAAQTLGISLATLYRKLETKQRE